MKIRYQINIRLCLLSVVLLGFWPLVAYPQEAGSCAEKLANAQALFDRGQVEQVPVMLRECLKDGFNREESLAAYKLIIQAYLFDDKLEMADSTMLAFLKKNPEYQLSPTDHSSFVHLFNNFKVKPIVQIAVHLGSNMPFVTFVTPVTTASEQSSNKYSAELLNLYTSVEARFAINRKLELNVEVGYSQLKFINEEIIKNDDVEHDFISYTESQKRLEVPVSATYSFKNFGRFTLYGRLGAGAALSFKSTAIASKASTDLNAYGILSGKELDLKDSRIPVDFFTQIGAGIKFKTPGGYFFTEIRSNFGFRNQTVRGGSTVDELRSYYGYVDDDFHLNTLNFSLGYTLLFYKPSKIQ